MTAAIGWGDRRESTAVLIVESDASSAESCERALLAVGLDVTVVAAGDRGIAAVERDSYAVIVLDLSLADMDGMVVLRALAFRANRPSVVVVGTPSTRVTVEAVRLGALDVLEKPVNIEELVRVVLSALPRRTQTHVSLDTPVGLYGNRGSVAYRWATYVVAVCTANEDMKTLRSWAKQVGVSYTTVCETCRILGVRPHDARDLARALFAIIQSARWECPPSVLLNVSDTRTLRVFTERAGPNFRPADDVTSLHRFFDSQRFVKSDNPGMKIVRRLVSEALATSRHRSA